MMMKIMMMMMAVMVRLMLILYQRDLGLDSTDSFSQASEAHPAFALTLIMMRFYHDVDDDDKHDDDKRDDEKHDDGDDLNHDSFSQASAAHPVFALTLIMMRFRMMMI